jgi:hypothetical protein
MVVVVGLTVVVVCWMVVVVVVCWMVVVVVVCLTVVVVFDISIDGSSSDQYSSMLDGSKSV